jgi:hypothetical protein
MVRILHILLVLSFVVVPVACNRSGWQAGLQGAAAGVAHAQTAPPKLMLFGGEGHKTYLGCLNCPKYASDSVFNEYGPHGST